MTVLAKSVAFLGITPGFSAARFPAFLGIIDETPITDGFEVGQRCAIVGGRENTALVSGSNCANVPGDENTVTVTDGSTCADI